MRTGFLWVYNAEFDKWQITFEDETNRFKFTGLEAEPIRASNILGPNIKADEKCEMSDDGVAWNQFGFGGYIYVDGRWMPRNTTGVTYEYVLRVPPKPTIKVIADGDDVTPKMTKGIIGNIMGRLKKRVNK